MERRSGEDQNMEECCAQAGIKSRSVEYGTKKEGERGSQRLQRTVNETLLSSSFEQQILLCVTFLLG